MERLEDDSDMVSAKTREPVFVHIGKILSERGDNTVRDPLKAPGKHQQRRFARAGRPCETERFSLCDLKGNSPQYFDRARVSR